MNISNEIDKNKTGIILKERARMLAQQEEKGQINSLEILKFNLANETYAFETKDVKEVINVNEITSLPSTPDFLIGIINLRGEIISVIDLRHFFHLNTPEIKGINPIIILEDSNRVLGILADKIIGVFEIPEENIQPSLPTLDVNRHRYLKGITGNRIIILNAKNILTDKNLIIDDEF